MTGRLRSPLVTVGVPVHDGEAYLARALESILSQDLADIEVLVADNASSDATVDIVRSFARRDPRVGLVGSDVNRGAAWNFNRLVGMARAPYFKWAAYDDECRPAHLRRCVDLLAERPAAVLAYPRTVLIDTESRVVGDFEDGLDLRQRRPHQRLAHLLRSQTEYHPVFGVVRTGALRRTRLIDRFPGSDIVLLAELAMAGEICEVPERLFARRFHAATSMAACPCPEDRADWFDPARARRRVWPLARVGAELVRSAQAAPVGAAERARCVTAVGRWWVVPRWRSIAGEVKGSVAAVLGVAAAPPATGSRPAASARAGPA